MSTLLTAAAGIVLLALMAAGAGIIGHLAAKAVFWLWDRR